MEEIKEIRWDILEYEKKDKKADWYFALGIISISASIASFLLDNILFGIFIIIGAITLAMYGVRKPKMLRIKINTRGVFINNMLYPLNTLKSFWIEDYANTPKILIQSEKTFVPYIVIPMKESDIDTVRIFLLEHLKEEVLVEPLPQKIMEYLGF